MSDAIYRDINDPQFTKKKSSTDNSQQEKPKFVTGMGDPPEQKAQEKKQPEYRFKSIRLIEPPQGYEINKPFDIEGDVEDLHAKDGFTNKHAKLFPVASYKDKEEEYAPAGIDVFIDMETLTFKGTCKYLYYPFNYGMDREKPAGTTFNLVVRAKGKTAEKDFESEIFLFPRESKFVLLKKGHYDDNGADKYHHPKSGDNYIPKGLVKLLQGDLITIGMLPKVADDGFFGDVTEAAVKEFQTYAIKTDRMQRKVGKVEKGDRVLDQKEPDGIVGKKTREQLDWWLSHDFVKPVPVLRHGEVDDEGVRTGVADRGSDDHHINTPIVDFQKDLLQIALNPGKIDGWLGDKTKTSVEILQDAMAKNSFIDKNGNTVKLEEHEKQQVKIKGAGDPATVKTAKVLVKRGWKVETQSTEPKWIEIAKKELGQTEIKGSKNNPRIIEYHNSTSLKATDDETAWCSAFINWCMTKAGYKGTNNAKATSWKQWGKKLNKPMYGCIVIIDYSYKGEKYKGNGHVGFAVGGDSDLNLFLLGGNQSDSVKVSKFRCSAIAQHLTYVVPDDYDSKIVLTPYKEHLEESSYESTR